MKKILNESLFSYVMDTILGYAARREAENDIEFQSYLKKSSEDIARVTAELEKTVKRAQELQKKRK